MPLPELRSWVGFKMSVRCALLCWGLGWLTDGIAFSDEVPVAPASAPVDTPDAREKREKLKAVIAAVCENEDLFSSLDTAYRTSWKFHHPPVTDVEEEEDLETMDDLIETRRQVTHGDRLYFSGNRSAIPKSGDERTVRTVAACDGQRTLVITEGNSATLFRRRYEPAAMLPPHSWGLFAFEVNFPLSVYLGGIEAMKSHLKVRWKERAARFACNKVEAEWLGEEMVGGLACVKIQVRRWRDPQDPPVIQTLWLAKDRNHHVARCQQNRERDNAEPASDITQVLKWRELGPGLWLPSHIDNQQTVPNSDPSLLPVPLWTRRLTLINAERNSVVADELFRLPEVPRLLPKFEVSAEGQLVDGPHFPRAVASHPQTTLRTILDRVIVEESKYHAIDVETSVSYRNLDRSDNDSGSNTSTSESSIRSLISHQRMLHLESKQGAFVVGQGFAVTQHRVFDGQKTCQVFKYTTSGNPKSQYDATLSWAVKPDVQSIRPYLPSLVEARKQQVLSAIFENEVVIDRDGNEPLKIEYVGDEIVGDLHCHKLKCSDPDAGRNLHQGFYLLWLARDRNLTVARREAYGGGGRLQLPTGLEFVESWREIRPGVWFPELTTTLGFQWSNSDGLCAGRPLLRWQEVQRLKSLTVDSIVDAEAFSPSRVPEGTRILVTDVDGKQLGHIKQAAAGKIDLTLLQLLELRVKKAFEK